MLPGPQRIRCDCDAGSPARNAMTWRCKRPRRSMRHEPTASARPSSYADRAARSRRTDTVPRVRRRRRRRQLRRRSAGDRSDRAPDDRDDAEIGSATAGGGCAIAMACDLRSARIARALACQCRVRSAATCRWPTPRAGRSDQPGLTRPADHRPDDRRARRERRPGQRGPLGLAGAGDDPGRRAVDARAARSRRPRKC